jgi:hypothetical protein
MATKKPSKKFVAEMEKMYPNGATITPKKGMSEAKMPMRGQRTAKNKMNKKKV